MENNQVNKATLIGLPSSGKSTFVAAFWHVVDSGEIDSQYSVETLPGNRQYLNKIRDKWLECEDIGRTSTEFQTNISLTLTEKDTGREINLVFPDLNGEIFEGQIEFRKLEQNYIKSIQEVQGLLLFINPSTLTKPVLISEINAVLAEPDKENHPEKTVAETNVQIKTWQVKESPTQIKLVELLQFISHYRKQSLKIGIIISAWDLIADSADDDLASSSPSKWVKDYLPLLFQYVVANSEVFNAEYFGVSAQGGNYETATEQLQQLDQPSKRIRVRFREDTLNDITIPFKWLLAQEN